MTILGFPVCEYLCLAIFMVYDAYSWHSRLWVVTVPCHISCLFIKISVCGYLCLAISMPLHDACSWLLRLWVVIVPGHILCLIIMLSRLWVATVLCHISCLILMPVLDSLESEWLLCFAISYACSWYMPCSLWVSVSCYIYASSWCLFFPGCEWPLCLAIYYAHSWCLLPFQGVSG